MKTILSILLLVSILLNAALIYEVANTGPKYEAPQFSDAERKILSEAVAAIGKEYPLGAYPYEIEDTSEGYIVKFQDYAYLQLLRSPFRDSEIYDACVFYTFNRDLSEYERQPADSYDA